VRANRQLAVALRDQGMNAEADLFAYRAQVLKQDVLWRQALYCSPTPCERHGLRLGLQQRARKLAAYLGSLLLDLISGSGYRPLRSFLTYLLVIVGFAGAYFLIGPAAHVHLSPSESLIFSVTTFHGRGFTPSENVGLANPLTALVALEAVLGLLIEITFIATFTQRVFAR
jgi:hypothetical protein